MKIIDIRLTIHDDVDENRLMWQLVGLLIQEELVDTAAIWSSIKGLCQMELNQQPKFVSMTNPEQG